MPTIKAFRGLLPSIEQVQTLVAPPYDVLNSKQAKELAKENPLSFLHISKPEIDLPNDIDVYSDQVYLGGKAYLQQFIQQGLLSHDDHARYYIYQIQTWETTQTGLVCLTSVQDYANNIIHKHENTRPEKERDRYKHITCLQGQISPVLLTYQDDDLLHSLLVEQTASAALYTVKDRNNNTHLLWPLAPEASHRIERAFQSLPAFYIADGHHRFSAALLAADLENPQASSNYCLSVLFPANELTLLGYHRVICKIPLAPEQFWHEMTERFVIQSRVAPHAPERDHQFCLYYQGYWHLLTSKNYFTDPKNPVSQLPVSILKQTFLEPILGIIDERTDDNLDFVGGPHAFNEMEILVNQNQFQLAIAVKPTNMNALLTIAEANQVMPPKSTWFEPKLLDGLVSYLF